MSEGRVIPVVGAHGITRRRVAAAVLLTFGLLTTGHVVEADLSDLDQSAGWIRSAEAALGPIDMLVNNAGSVLSGRFVDVSS